MHMMFPKQLRNTVTCVALFNRLVDLGFSTRNFFSAK
jgi:hypothetical protein